MKRFGWCLFLGLLLFCVNRCVSAQVINDREISETIRGNYGYQPSQNEQVSLIAMRNAEKEVSRFDLTPSYAKQLTHVEVCGVVVCQADFPLKEIERIMHDIELLQLDLSRYLAIPQAKEKIELCLFRNQDTYVAFLQKNFPDAPQDRRALYVKKRQGGILMVQRGKNFEIDLRHEMTHAILHASLKEVPIWLDEGLAKYFELTVDERAYGSPYLKSVRNQLRFKIVPSLSRLEKLQIIDDMGEREYKESWAWTHFLLHRSPETHKLLASYLQMLGNEKLDPNKIPRLEPMIRNLLNDSKGEFLQHFKSWEPQD